TSQLFFTLLFFFLHQYPTHRYLHSFPTRRSSDLIIELNALHTKRQNLFQELDAVIHLLMEAKHWGLRKSRNATSLNSRWITASKIGRAVQQNAETDLVCRLLLEKKKNKNKTNGKIEA